MAFYLPKISLILRSTKGKYAQSTAASVKSIKTGFVHAQRALVGLAELVA